MKTATVAVIGGLGFTVTVAAVVLLVFVPMCSNKLEGEATVDGKAFVPDSCRSGQRWNFMGVEIQAKDGRRLRAAQTPSGGGVVFLFDPGSDRGRELGECADLHVERQHSTINNVTNVEGTVGLHCKGDEHVVTGSITFETCH
jgi:hypothetical protein